MRVGFDLDGVLADLPRALDALAAESRDETPAPTQAATSLALEGETPSQAESRGRGLTGARRAAVWARALATTNFWETLAEIEEGTIAKLWSCSVQHGWDVQFITDRPPSAGDSPLAQTRRWLSARGFPDPRLTVARGGRARLAASMGLDAFVDDRRDNCIDLEAAGVRALAVTRDPDPRVTVSAARLGIEIVPSAAAALDALLRPAPEVRTRTRAEPFAEDEVPPF